MGIFPARSTSDSNSVADINALSNHACPTGSMIPYAGSSSPSTDWLLCDGTGYSRATYSALFAIISTTYGSTDVNTFAVPDMRETVPVGVGTRGSGVTAHDTYTLGQFKDDQKQANWLAPANETTKHLVVQTQNLATVGGAADGNSSIIAVSNTGAGRDASVLLPITDGTNGTPRVGTVTRTKQIGVNWIIKT